MSETFAPADLVAEAKHELRVGLGPRILSATVCLALGIPPGALSAAPFQEPPLPYFPEAHGSPAGPPQPFFWPGVGALSNQLGPRDRSDERFGAPGNLAIAWQDLVLGPERQIVSPVLLQAENDPTDPGAEEAYWQPGQAAGDADILPPPDGVPVMPLENNGGGIPGIVDAIGNCVITGEVSDATSLDPIAGAIVDVVGTGRTAETDAQGRFRLEGFAPGTYTIEVNQLGYFTETNVVTAIEAQAAETRFGLRARPTEDSSAEFMLEEETVVGEYQGDSAGDLFLDLQITPNIAAGISKEEFTKTGIGDAAGAVSKIAGANIVGGKYAVVRGLGDRYSNTLVNGAQISSADPSKKAVQLDLFPSDLLESVSIFKTFTPDLPAEFAGGTVVIDTLRFPTERIVEASVGTGWNTNLGGTRMKTIPGREFDFWGKTGDEFPEAAGDVETGLSIGYSGTRPLDRATAAQRAAAEEAAAAFSAIHGSARMRPGSRGVEPGRSLALTLGDTFKPAGNLEVGTVFAFTWDKSDSIREGVQVGRLFNPGSDGISYTPDDRLDRSGFEDRYTASLNWGLLASMGAKVGENHEIGMTYFRNSSREDQVTIGDRQRRQDADNLEYLPASRTPSGAGAYSYLGFDNLVPLHRDLDLIQADGRHAFGKDGGIELEWALARSESLEDRPHSRSLFYYQLDYADPRIRDLQGDIYMPELGVVETAADVPAATQGTGTLQSFRETLSTEEKANNARMDLTLPGFRRDDDHFLNFRIGTNRFEREREVRGRFFIYEIPSPLNAILVGNGGQAGSDYLDSYDSVIGLDGESKFEGWTGTGGRNNSDGLILTEATKSGRTVRNVDAASEVTATYLMSTYRNGPWDIVGGARIEKDTRSYQVLSGLNNQAFVNDEPVEIDNENILPGITISRKFGSEDQLSATFAWSKTVARPTFYEFAPVQTEDQATGDIIVGNPDLVDTQIDNYDLRINWAPKPSAMLSLSLFHKSMVSPIAQAYELRRKTWVNGEQGKLKGIEIEARQQFGDSWSLSSNYTFIDSLLRYNQRVGTSGIQTIDSTYEGQPGDILNVILGYDNKDSGYSANLIYNFTGSYLTGVPLTADSPAIRREAFQSLDLVLAKRFEVKDCVGTVKLKVGNLLDEKDTELFEDTNFVYRSYRPGRSLSLSFDLEF